MRFPWIIMLSLQTVLSSGDDIIYILSTRNSSDIKLRAADVVQTNLELGKTILIVHGWTETPNSAHYVKIKDEYLKKYKCTVLRVDWSHFGNNSYNEAKSKVQSIGKAIGDALTSLHKNGRIANEKLLIVGHSLGSHIAGFAGKSFESNTGLKIFSIFGLDPAGPSFEGRPSSERLSQSDAGSVVVLHTDGVFGYKQSLGTLDFYANAGDLVQPGCSVWDLVTNVESVFCSHHKSYVYFTEAINNPKYEATECNSWFNYHLGLCQANSKVVFSEDVRSNVTGNYYFRTGVEILTRI